MPLVEGQVNYWRSAFWGSSTWDSGGTAILNVCNIYHICRQCWL